MFSTQLFKDIVARKILTQPLSECEFEWAKWITFLPSLEQHQVIRSHKKRLCHHSRLCFTSVSIYGFMSIHFNWEQLTEDSERIEASICDFLHSQFQSIALPPFIESLAVSSFKLGSSPPEVTLKHFSDPFEEFYENDRELDELESEEYGDSRESSEEAADSTTVVYKDSSPGVFAPSVPRTLNYAMFKDQRMPSPETGHSTDPKHTDESDPFDIQTFVELKYAGDMQLAISVKLLVNYPAPSFISLPLAIRVTGIDIHSLVVAAHIRNRIHISILSDLNDTDVVPSERANVIQNMHIESEIGDNSDHGAVLRNVGKVEKFVLEQLRKVIRDELVWPGWITLEL